MYRRVDFWDSKISGKKKLAVDSNILALDESGSSHFECIFKINNHTFKLSQKSEDKFSLSIDHYKFKSLMSEEAKGNLAFLIEQSQKNPLDDVDKLLKSQIDKEKKERKEKQEKEAKEKAQKLMKELQKEKEKEKEFDFISAKDIKEIKNNLNNKNDKSDKNKEIFEQNKNILNNISVFNESKKPQSSENINDFKRNSNMFGLDFFTGDKEINNDNKNNIKNNNSIKNNNNYNPFNNKNNYNNEQENNNMKNAQNPHNKEVLNQLMNKIVPEKHDNNKELEMLFDEFNGEENNDNNNLYKNKMSDLNKNDNINNNFNNNIFNEINNNIIKKNSNNNNTNPQNLEDTKKMNSTPFDDDDDIL